MWAWIASKIIPAVLDWTAAFFAALFKRIGEVSELTERQKQRLALAKEVREISEEIKKLAKEGKEIPPELREKLREAGRRFMRSSVVPPQ